MGGRRPCQQVIHSGRHISEQRTLIKTTVRFRRKIQLSILAGFREQRATFAVSLRSSAKVPIWILFSMCSPDSCRQRVINGGWTWTIRILLQEILQRVSQCLFRCNTWLWPTPSVPAPYSNRFNPTPKTGAATISCLFFSITVALQVTSTWRRQPRASCLLKRSFLHNQHN